VRLSVNHHVAGALRVEASATGADWSLIGTLDGRHLNGEFDLPPALFPAPETRVRLSMPDSAGSLQVNRFEYEAKLLDRPPAAEGRTHFLEVLQRRPELAVRLERLRLREDQGRWQMEFAVTNQTGSPVPLRASLSTDRTTPGAGERQTVTLDPSGRVSLSCPAVEPGPRELGILMRAASGQTLFAGRTRVELGWLSDPRPGCWLGHTNGLGLWWCESGWKIGRGRGLPARPRDGRPVPVAVSAARGEYEAVQVVLRPEQEGQLTAAAVSPLRPEGDPGAPLTVRVDEVGYVQVTVPTDASSQRGSYPDPLPPLRLPLQLRAGENQPLWLTVFVPREAAAGDYAGALALETSWGTMQVPLAVHVHDFVLPQETHLQSALGLGSGAINRYHRLEQAEDRERVFEKYLRNFAAHRISPYSFYDYAPVELRFVGEGARQQARVDFTRFDRAASRWLDQARFSTFQWPLRGMGGGTFHSRHLGELAGFQEGTPEHARLFRDYLGQVERHLRERGWLAKAFTYWFDEPDPKDYEFVIAGMKRLQEAAPGLKRMLTEQPEPELQGQVDIWCGLTPAWTPEKVRARHDAGEEVWWYICTAPKAPYVTEFIDHPGTELRLWPWQSWQYGVSGILIWATIYWTSPLAYPEPTLQDPWQDPMSWVSGYGLAVGHRAPWGNGDGRFLYPPRRDPNRATAPCLDAPINSLRWENLRDGMEDYEYLWLLDQTAREASARGAADPALMARARRLLEVPPEISLDLTRFTTDPRPILRHREQIARLIETLRRDRR
jgi:hypothetical protein